MVSGHRYVYYIRSREAPPLFGRIHYAFFILGIETNKAAVAMLSTLLKRERQECFHILVYKMFKNVGD